jgi:hypothetical protein
MILAGKSGLLPVVHAKVPQIPLHHQNSKTGKKQMRIIKLTSNVLKSKALQSESQE